MTDWGTTVEPTHVLGVTLREPITLGHVMLLDELGSPLLHGGEVAIGDVALAAFVCLWPADKSRRKLRNRTAKLAFRLWAHFWKPGADAERFTDWFAAQVKLPEMWQEETRGRKTELAAPWWINRVTLALQSGLSFSEAMSLPLRTVNLVIAAKLEATGVCEFVSSRQRDFFRQVEEWQKPGVGRN